MRILGVDPGFAITGYSIIDYIGNKFKLEKSGAILTEAKTSFPLRLEKIYNETEIAPKENTEEGVDTTESAIDRFNTYPKIKSATVDTHGINYGNPVTEKAFDYSAYMYDLMSSYYNTNAEQ